MKNLKHTFYVPLLVYAALLVAVAFYIRREVETLHVTGVEFVHVGMMEFNDNGTKVYVPVYRRNE